jgi:hypothetical protein
MGLWRFGNGRIGRTRGEPEEESESESESDRVDEESLVTLPDEEDELAIEHDRLAGRCSKTPSPKFYISIEYICYPLRQKRMDEFRGLAISTTCSSASSMFSISMLRGSLWDKSTLDCSIWGRNSRTLASTVAVMSWLDRGFEWRIMGWHTFSWWFYGKRPAHSEIK